MKPPGRAMALMVAWSTTLNWKLKRVSEVAATRRPTARDACPSARRNWRRLQPPEPPVQVAHHCMILTFPRRNRSLAQSRLHGQDVLLGLGGQVPLGAV